MSVIELDKGCLDKISELLMCSFHKNSLEITHYFNRD